MVQSVAKMDFRGVLTLAAETCDTGFAVVDFVDGKRQWSRRHSGRRAPDYKPGKAINAELAGGNGLLIVGDAASDPRFAGDRPCLDGTPVGFCAMLSLRAADGTVVAVFSVLDMAPRPQELSIIGRHALEVLGRQIETMLDLLKSVSERDRLMSDQTAMTNRLEWAATHDSLTSLPNRVLFEAQLNDVISDPRYAGACCALMLVDIDHFKVVNEVLGHVGGDAVLQHYAVRLKSLVAPDGMVARIGGDEFAIIFPDVIDMTCAKRRAEEVAEGMRLPMLHDGRMVDGRSSIGVALYPNHGGDIEVLTKAADLALRAAKRAGRDRAVVFDKDLEAEAARHKTVLAAARAAFDEGRMTVYYQPKIRLSDSRLRGLEALLRWTLPDGELVLPGAWAEALIDPQLSPEISMRIIDMVLKDASAWHAAGIEFGHVAINSGAMDFTGSAFTEQLLGALGSLRLPPELVQIEVTESVFLGRSNGQAHRALQALSDCGVRIALDDFGTGYASLTHLKRYPIDIVKIDRSFVSGVDESVEDKAIVRSIIALANELGIESVAEGIETPAQVEFLRASGCDCGQGFLFSEALPVDQIVELIARMERA